TKPYLSGPSRLSVERSETVRHDFAEQCDWRRDELPSVPGDPGEAGTGLFRLFLPYGPSRQRTFYHIYRDCAETDKRGAGHYDGSASPAENFRVIGRRAAQRERAIERKL